MQGLALRIRVVVVNQLPLQEHNAMLHLFGAREELLRYGREHYRPHSPETSTLLFQLLNVYSQEELDMTSEEKLKQFVRQTIDEMLASQPAEKLRKRLSIEQRLEGLSAEEVIRGLPPETLEALAQQLKAEGRSSKPQGKKEGESEH